MLSTFHLLLTLLRNIDMTFDCRGNTCKINNELHLYT